MMRWSLWTIFSALVSAPRAGSLAWKTNCSKVLFSLSGPSSKVVSLPSSHWTSRPVVAVQLVADRPDVLRDVQHDGLVLEVLDLVLDDHFAVVQVAGDAVLLVLVDGAFDHHVLGHADVEPHLVVQRGELAPVLAEEGRAAVAVVLEDADLAELQRRHAQVVGLVVLQHVVHRHQQLVLRAVEPAVGLRVAGVGLLDRHLGELLHQHLLGLVDADRLEEAGAETGPQPGRAERLVGQVLDAHVLGEHQRLLVVRGHRPVVEALGEVAQQVADADAGRARVAGGDLPDQGRLVGRIADREDFHVQGLGFLGGRPALAAAFGGLAVRARDHAEDDRVRVDLGVGPGEIDLVDPLDQGDDPLLLDQRGAGVVQLDFHPFPHGQGDQLDPGHRRGGQGRNGGGHEEPECQSTVSHGVAPWV